jgi:hypothetical protein
MSREKAIFKRKKWLTWVTRLANFRLSGRAARFLPKVTQIVILGLKIYNLATLLSEDS